MLASVIDEVLVGFVDDDMQIRFESGFGDRLQLGASEHDARRVVGVAQDENPGARRHPLAHRLDVEGEAAGADERKADRRAVRDPHHGLEAKPARIGNEHFVAYVRQREQSREQPCHSARRHHDFRFRVGPDVVHPQKLVRHRFAKLRQTPHVGVGGGVGAAQHLDGRILGARGRIASFPEVEHVDALLPELADPIHESKGSGYSDTLHPGRNGRVVHCFVSLVLGLPVRTGGLEHRPFVRRRSTTRIGCAASTQRLQAESRRRLDHPRAVQETRIAEFRHTKFRGERFDRDSRRVDGLGTTTWHPVMPLPCDCPP